MPKLETRDEGNSVTKYVYTPPEPGTYTADIEFGNVPIPKSPFSYNVLPQGETPVVELVEQVLESGVEAGMDHLFPDVHATGKGLSEACVQEWACFEVDYSKAAPGKLDVSIVGPEKKNPEMNIEQQGVGKAMVKYLPSVEGTYTVNVVFDGKSIRGSPFEANASYDGGQGDVVKLKAEGTKVNQSFEYSVSISGVAKPSLTAKIVGPYHHQKVPDELLSASLTLNTLKKFMPQKPIQPKVSLKDSVYHVQFVPKEVGVYVLVIFQNGSPAASTPYKISVCDPEAVQLTGSGCKGSEGEIYYVNRSLCWAADCTNAGPGRVQAFIFGPNKFNKEVQVEPAPGKADQHYIQHIPDLPGSYKLVVAHSGFKTGHAPVVHVSDPTRATVDATQRRTAQIGEEVKFNVDLSNAGSGRLQADVNGPVKVPINFSKGKGGMCTFSITPPAVGLYVLDLRFGNKSLSDKPLEVEVIDPAKVLVTGSGVTGRGAEVDHSAKVIVDVTEAGKLPLKASLFFPNGQEQLLQLLPKRKDDVSIFEAEYVPIAIGFYKLVVLANNEPVHGSPFTVPISKPQEVKLLESVPLFAIPGKPSVMNFSTTNAGPGKLDVTFSTPSQSNHVQWSMQQKENGFALTYTLPELGGYTALVSYNDTPIGGPIDIHGGDPSKVEVTGEGVTSPLMVNKETEFLVSTSNAGVGRIASTITSPAGSNVETVELKVDEDSHIFKYVPEHEGSYIINVTFGGHPAANSPFTVATGAKKVIAEVSGSGITGRGARVGKPAEVLVMTDQIKEVPVEAIVTIPSGKKQTVALSTTKESKHIFHGKYIPSSEGIHKVEVSINGSPVQTSPFMVNVAGPNAAKLFAEKPVVTEEENQIELHLPKVNPQEVTALFHTPEFQPLSYSCAN